MGGGGAIILALLMDMTKLMTVGFGIGMNLTWGVYMHWSSNCLLLNHRYCNNKKKTKNI